MRLARGVRRIVRVGVLALALAPAAALPLAAVLDRGPDPSAGLRAAAFPAALTLWDPFLWLCARNSLAAATVVATVSLAVGVPLGAIVGRRRYWGAGVLGFLASSPILIPPALVAIGLRRLLRSDLPDFAGWSAFLWVGVAGGVPWVARATRAALGRIEAAWEDAARIEGASRWRIWRERIWPLLRPEATAAAGMVFSLSLLDPSVPLIFGLRRTLAFQIVEAAAGPDAWPPRLATLALLASALAIAGRLAFRGRLGQTPFLDETAVSTPRRPARWPLATLLVIALSLWIVVAWAPVGVAVGLALEAGGGPVRSVTSVREFLAQRLDGPELRAVGAASLFVGLASGGLACLAALILGPGLRRWRSLTLVPPLAIGAGALMIPYLLDGLSEGLSFRGGEGARLGWVRELARGLDPYASTGYLLVWTLATLQLPFLAATIAAGRGRVGAVEAAITLGASRRRAQWDVRRRMIGPVIRAGLFASILSATNLSPALLLAPTSPARPAGPALLLDAGEPGLLPRAATLGLVMLAANLIAWAIRVPSAETRSAVYPAH